MNLKKMGMVLAVIGLAAISAKAAFDWKQGLQKDNIEEFGLMGKHTIALTFDDGPGEGTAELLDLLKEYDVKATFFVIGENAAKPEYEEVMKRIVAEGHVLGNHTYTHPHLTESLYLKNPKKLIAELRSTDTLIKKYLPPDANLYFRAPYGEWTSQDAAIVNRDPVLANYIGPFDWDSGGGAEFDSYGNLIDAADWECWEDKKWTPEYCMVGYESAITRHDGGVVLTHTVYKETTAMWKMLLPKLVDRGFKFVTVEEIPSLRH